MKTYNHIKTGILFFVLCSLFFFSCSDIFQPPKPEQPAAGKGYLSLSIGGVLAGRTILPKTTADDFKSYELVFTPSGGDPFTVKSANLTQPILLNTGTYNLKVTAYMNDYEYPAAEKIEEGIEIEAGKNTSIKLTLKAIITEGTGTFSWNIQYPSDVTTAIMTITQFTEEGEVLVNGPINLAEKTPSFIVLNAGYYRVLIKLTRNNGGIEETAELREILHIYQNMESVLNHTFENSHFTGALFVTNGFDGENEGSLRWAINTAIEREGSTTIIIDSSVKTITLDKSLTINDDSETINITIEGNGVTITQQGSSIDDSSTLFNVFSNGGNNPIITIRRVHFKNGKGESAGAIFNDGTTLTLESCIFSGNQSNRGGAINTSSGTIHITGCTFYGNNAVYTGGAIYYGNGTMYFKGNLFYGNTASNFPVIHQNGSGYVYPLGYNVVDIESGDNYAWGWVPSADDIYAPNPTVMQRTFNPISENGATNVITPLPSDYPTADFYGYPITAGAAAGAVQEPENGAYYTVTFNSNGGKYTGVSVVAVKSGDTIEEPIEPTWHGNEFVGWYTDPPVSEWNFNTNTVSNNFTLYAQWDAEAFWEGLAAPPTTLAKKLEWLDDNAQDGGSYTIIVDSNVSLNATELDYVDGYWEKVSITLKSKDDIKTITITNTGGSLFTIKAGVTLILENITLQGLHSNGGEGSDNTAPLVYIASNGTLIMNNGSTITGNTNTDSNGGGVYVTGGTFIMNGGKISGNHASNGGGVYVAQNGIFRITGGTVYGNNEGGDSLKNTVISGGTGAALYKDTKGFAQYYSKSVDGSWTWTDLLLSDATDEDNTIKVVDGRAEINNK